MHRRLPSNHCDRHDHEPSRLGASPGVAGAARGDAEDTIRHASYTAWGQPCGQEPVRGNATSGRAAWTALWTAVDIRAGAVEQERPRGGQPGVTAGATTGRPRPVPGDPAVLDSSSTARRTPHLRRQALSPSSTRVKTRNELRPPWSCEHPHLPDEHDPTASIVPVHPGPAPRVLSCGRSGWTPPSPSSLAPKGG